MSQLDIEKGFLVAWRDTNSAFGLPTVYENKPYTPTPQTAYAEIINISNPLDPNSLADTDETTGIFRVILRYPLDAGAITAKAKAQQILDYFSIGTSITYSGQSAIIQKTTRQNGANDDGWYKIVVSIQYFAFITR